jgi:hypothetical protein
VEARVGVVVEFEDVASDAKAEVSEGSTRHRTKRGWVSSISLFALDHVGPRPNGVFNVLRKMAGQLCIFPTCMAVAY